MVSKAAQRYAIALLELAKEKQAVDQTLEDINLIKDVLNESRDLRVFLKSPIIKPENKQAVIDSIFGGKVSDLVHNFLKLVAGKGRVDILTDIADAFINKYNQFSGIINVEVSTAHELDENQKSELSGVLEKITGNKVVLIINVQPDLKGGMAVKINDTVIDGTVKHKLEQLEQKFLETAAV